MSETTQEPTMEEILASIRRIISEDEPSAAASAEPAKSQGDDHADVLDLTHKVEPTVGGDLAQTMEREEAPREPPEEPAERVGDLDVFDAAPTPANQTSSAPSQPAPQSPLRDASAPATPPKPGFSMSDQPLVSEHAAQAAASRFGALEESVKIDHGVAMPSGQTMDQVIREMLNPMLKAWLDEHLETIVDAKVQAEVERISRRR